MPTRTCTYHTIMLLTRMTYTYRISLLEMDQGRWHEQRNQQHHDQSQNLIFTATHKNAIRTMHTNESVYTCT